MTIYQRSNTVLCQTTALKLLQKRGFRQCTTTYQIENKTAQCAPRRRVVVTGIGVVSPVGCDSKTAWANILNGFCGIKTLNDPKYESFPCKLAAQIDEEKLQLQSHFSKSELRTISPATAYALVAGSIRQIVLENVWNRLRKTCILYSNCSERSFENG